MTVFDLLTDMNTGGLENSMDHEYIGLPLSPSLNSESTGSPCERFLKPAEREVCSGSHCLAFSHVHT